jgi:putative cell wall-binding protein
VRKARKPLAILLAVAMMLCMAPAAVFGASDNSDVERIAEHDRYMTAAKIAETAFPDGTKTVVIANGEDTLDYADALAGSFLAGVVKAPILLTRTDTLPKATKDVIRGKLGATEAYILGGTAAVSEAVVSELKDDLKLKVTRVAGVNRFETAAKILEVGAKLGAEVPDTALIANGTRPADGLVASAYAYKENIPVLLVLQNNIPPETKKALKGIRNTYVIGGEFVVSDDILNALPNATRLSGDTRFHTSVAVAKQFWKSPAIFALVQGIDGLVDALAGAVLGVPILYVAPDQPDPQAVEPQVVADYLDSAITENSSGFVLGGRISANVVNAVQQKIEQKKEQKKPIADLKVVEVTAVDANTIKVIFEGVDEPVTIKLDEALVHGQNEVTFEYEGVEYTVTVDYVDPEYKDPDEDDPIDTGLITAIKGAQDAIKALPALSDLDLGAKKDVETARAKVEQAKKLGATNIDIGLDLIDILEKAEAKIALLEAKTALQMKINEATEFNEADYTAASWQALQAALANARSAAADENASQTQIDQALDDLNAAISALVEKHIWQTVTIAWSDNIAGLFTSMDTDSFGRPHISYYDATDGDLMYVWQDDSGWHSETVDSEGNTGKFTSLAVDANGIPHISYYDLTNGKIKHAIRNNSTWEKTEVDEVCTGVDGGYYTGVSTSIAIDNSHRPHISYYDYNQQCLKHAWLEGSVWEREIVEAPLTKTGECSSISTDSQGRPHIAYSDKNKNQLKYAYKSGETGERIVSYRDLLNMPAEPIEIAVKPNDIAACLFTSGTTGKPKGALLSHSNLVFDVQASTERIQMDSQDQHLCVLPLFHSFALMATLLCPLYTGGSIVVLPQFHPNLVLQEITSKKVTVFYGIPTMFASILPVLEKPNDYDLKSLRLCIAGGAPTPVELMQIFEDRYKVVILEGDGPTETSPVAYVNPPELRKLGSAGSVLISCGGVVSGSVVAYFSLPPPAGS